ncbi:MAG: GAF domain-containing protein [Anaerolineales bacterium]|nr:GAF domain-containing protein [Anaerolineales bacterium]
MRKLRSILATNIALLAILMAALIITSLYLFARQRTREATRQRLLDIVSLAVMQVDVDLHSTLTDPAQEGNADYLKIQRQLQAIRDIDPELVYVYSLRYQREPAPDGQVVFIVDAETDPEEVSHLGDVYYELDVETMQKISLLGEPSVEEDFYTDRWGTWLTAYAPLYTSGGRRDAVLGIDMSVDTVISYERQFLWVSLLIFLLITPAMAGLGWLFGNGLSRPLNQLTEGAKRVREGDLNYRVAVGDTGVGGLRPAEFEELAGDFNAMTSQLAETVGDLENRVAQRTQELEQRTAYLEATAQLSGMLSTILDQSELITVAVEQIRQRLDLYYVGLFLLDEKREWAILQAGTGTAGEAMLQRGHRLRVGGGSMIGWSIANAQPRIAQIAEEDRLRLATPELPETRAEAALPLRSRGQVLGALTLQSVSAGAFDEQTLRVLAVMADQVAVALDNARLFTESRQAIEAERRIVGQVGQEGWRQLLRTRSNLGYRWEEERGGQAKLVEGDWSPAMRQAMQTGQVVQDGEQLILPVLVRDMAIGVLRLSRPGSAEADNPGSENPSWSEGEIQTLQAVLIQVAQAIESARLYQSAQSMAQREQLTADATSRIRETLDIETVLRTTILEVQKALSASEVMISLGKPEGDGGNTDSLEAQRQETN